MLHQTIESDTGAACALPPPAPPPLPPLVPHIERALRLRAAKLQRERDAKAAAVEWCWRRSQQLTLEVMDDSRQLREFRQLLHMRGAFND